MSESQTRVILKDVDYYRVMEAMSEGVRIILNYRGEPFSPAYIQGISGAAFRMAGICPCAPTCSNIMEPVTLARKAGYASEWWPIQGSGQAVEYGLERIVARVKEEIRANRPVLLWHAFTNAEWDVVCGFDDDAGLFYGRGSYQGLDSQEYAQADQSRALTALEFSPALGAVFVGEKTGELNREQAEREALQEAVRHGFARKDEGGVDGKWVFLEGVQCYERWAREFREDPGRGRTPGDSYCVGIYRSTRRCAASFLRELASRYSAAGVDLRRGQQAFEREADLLDRCAPFLGWDTPAGPDAERNRRLADLLEQAGEAYADGIEAIQSSLKRM